MSPELEQKNVAFPNVRGDAIVAAVAVLLCRLLATWPCHLYDDAFITFRYARNLAAGAGLVYNPGAAWEPVLGTTTPAYAVVLAAVHWLGFDLVAAAPIVNALLDAATAALLMLLLLPVGRVAAFAAVAVLAISPELNRISAGGMEAPLLMLVVVAAVFCADRKRWTTAAVLASIAPIVRPEGVLAWPILAVCCLRSRRDLVRFTRPALAICATYVVATTLYFGSPIPQSVATKADHYLGHNGLLRSVELLRNTFAPSLLFAAALPFTLVGVIRGLSLPGPMRVLSVWTLVLLAAYLAARPLMPGWYYFPMLVGVCIWIGLGVDAAVVAVRVFRRPTFASCRRVVFLRVALLLCVLPIAAFAIARRDNVVRRDVYAPMQAWAATAAPSQRILAFDIGCIGYASDARILDGGGLVWPEAKTHRDQADLVRRHEPDYVLMTVVRSSIAPMQRDDTLARRYRPIRRFSRYGETDLAPDPDRLNDNWRQDYILYERIDATGHAVNSPRGGVLLATD